MGGGAWVFRSPLDRTVVGRSCDRGRTGQQSRAPCAHWVRQPSVARRGVSPLRPGRV